MMRALLIASGYAPEMGTINDRYPSPMIPCLDRPLIQHIIEYLSQRNFDRFTIFLCHYPEKIERILGDGTRWGVQIEYYLIRDPQQPYKLLKIIDLDSGSEPILLGHADRLPLTDFQAALHESTPLPILFEGTGRQEEASGLPPWTGWGWVTRDLIRQLDTNARENQLHRFLSPKAISPNGHVPVHHVLNVGSFEDILKTNQLILERNGRDLFLGGHEVEEGIWLSRNVSLDPTVQLIPPVYIGSNCQIERGVKLGPYAVVGSGTVLNARCTVSDSVIFPKSYVGERLELDHALVDKNCLVNLTIGMAIEVTDRFLLSGMTDSTVSSWIFSLLSRLAGLAGLAVFWPFLVLSVFITKVLGTGPILTPAECVQIPAASNKSTWRTFMLNRFIRRPVENLEMPKSSVAPISHFLFYFLPGLFNVLKGSIRIVGVDPRTKEEIDRLPVDWRELYLRSKAGLISECYIYYGSNPSDDEFYAAETFYTVHCTMKHDLRIAVYYFCQLLEIPFGPQKQGLNRTLDEINMENEENPGFQE